MEYKQITLTEIYIPIYWNVNDNGGDVEIMQAILK